MDNSKNIIIEEQIAKLKDVMMALETNSTFLSIVCNNLNELIKQ